MSSALTVISKSGLPQESTYPYAASNTVNGKPSTSGICNTNQLIQNSKKYTPFTYNYASDDDLRSYLQIGPLAVAFWADSNFTSYSSGVYSCSQSAESSNINHAVLLIGYDINNNWIIKNSWGTSWGESGFGYVTSDSSGNCGIGIEAYRLFAGRLFTLLSLTLLVSAIL